MGRKGVSTVDGATWDAGGLSYMVAIAGPAVSPGGSPRRLDALFLRVVVRACFPFSRPVDCWSGDKDGICSELAICDIWYWSARGLG